MSNLESYQIEAVKRALQRKRYGVFFQQRVGKSRVAIYFIKSLFETQNINKAIIICPLISRYVWKQEIEKLTDFKVCIVNSIKDLVKPVEDTIFILNYDKLVRFMDKLTRLNFEIVIADEVHMIKNRTSKRSKKMGTLGKNAIYTLGLTGTPYSNETGSKNHTSFQDLFGMYRFIDPSLFGTNWNRFKSTYCVMGGYMNYQVISYNNVDDILAKVDSSSMRVLRKDVMAEPTQLDVPVYVTLGTKAFKQYKEFEKEAFIELSNAEEVTVDLAITHRMRLQQFCGGFIRPDESEEYITIHTDKLKKLKELLSELEDKIIVSFKYLKELKSVREIFPDALVISGEVKEKTRQDVIKQFKDSDTNILLVQEQTVSVSLELSFCNKIIFYSIGDDLITHSQIRDRLMGRFQQSDEVQYYYLLCEKTIDTKIYKALKSNTKKSELYANWRTWLGGDD